MLFVTSGSTRKGRLAGAEGQTLDVVRTGEGGAAVMFMFMFMFMFILGQGRHVVQAMKVEL